MAQDGCQRPAWTGQAFPYLLHGASKPAQSGAEGARQLPAAEQAASVAASSDGNTGTWNGPAPRGAPAGPREAANGGLAASAQQPTSVLLNSGARMPLLGYGTYNVKGADAVRAALDAGYRHIDCAAFYKNQALVGEGLRGFTGGGRRGELFVTSKIWNDEHRPDALRKSAERSIGELGCEYLDLCLVHWPGAQKPGTFEADPGVTLQETWRAMEALVDDGLAKSIGVSNFSEAQIGDLLAYARIPPAVNQVELHPRLAQRRLVGFCVRKGLRCVAYSPLGQGNNGLLTLPEVLKVAEETGRSPAQVLLRWNVQRGVPVIPRSNTPANIEGNAKGLFDWALTEAQKALLDGLDQHKRFIQPSWHDFGDSKQG
ncbi:hypothetical protein WJX81_006636 [Elliptochloris bilobata]|uniref:NADP-dependent oxidoreductase domain-containing protein n=1 Tax=Elliptochloris bilobata TaxID=381761 RepID=A0AAW1QX76_9CHLO